MIDFKNGAFVKMKKNSKIVNAQVIEPWNCQEKCSLLNPQSF